jgi:predicted AlkP superfamily pyrophosphatase or phosphodiesterase
MNYRILIVLIAISFATVSCKNSPKETDDNYVVILSMDGFRWDYASRTETPNLDWIAENGVIAESMIPSFPTTTFANHYTMATGLYPGNHGILVNRFYAPDLGEHFNDKNNRGSVEDGRFYGGEPIWVTAENQNVTTATCFWVGSEADVQGIRPTYWKRYDHSMPYGDRIDTVVYWLGLPKEKRPKLVMFYFDEPDSSGHRFGPENDSLMPLITKLDSLVGVFLTKMQALPHADKINFIVVSDHGMGQLSNDKQIILDQYVDTSMLAFVDGWNPTMNIKVKDGFIDSIEAQLQNVPNLRYWKSGEGPERLHHGNHVRTHDVSIVADSGYSLYWSYAIANVRGTHGYDNANKDMHAIFYATGPDFKENYVKESFQNIHLYPLLAKLLKIQPAAIDGNFDSIKDVLKENK